MISSRIYWSMSPTLHNNIFLSPNNVPNTLWPNPSNNTDTKYSSWKWPTSKLQKPTSIRYACTTNTERMNPIFQISRSYRRQETFKNTAIQADFSHKENIFAKSTFPHNKLLDRGWMQRKSERHVLNKYGQQTNPNHS